MEAQLVNRVPRCPSSSRRCVISVVIVNQVRLGISNLIAHSKQIELGQRPCGSDDLSEGAILILCGDAAVGGVYQCNDVAVAIMGYEAIGSVAGFFQQASHAASALRTAAQVCSPHKGI